MKFCAIKFGTPSQRDILICKGLEINQNQRSFLGLSKLTGGHNYFTYKTSQLRRDILLIRDVIYCIKRCTDVLILNQQFRYKWLIFITSFLLKKGVYIDVYVSEYDVRMYDRKTLNNNLIRGLILRWKERFMFKKARICFFLSKTDMSYICNVLGISRGSVKWFILPLIVDINNEFDRGNSKSSNGLKLIWWGAFNRIHGLSIIIKSLSILRFEYDVDFRFDVFGSNRAKGRPYEDLVSALKLEKNVNFCYDKNFSDGSLVDIIKMGQYDLSFGLFGETLKAKNVISNKLVESLALGLPHLQIVSSALVDFDGLDNYIHTCEGTPQSLAQFLRTFKEFNPNSDVEEGYRLYNKYFSKTAFNETLTFLNENIISAYSKGRL